MPETLLALPFKFSCGLMAVVLACSGSAEEVPKTSLEVKEWTVMDLAKEPKNGEIAPVSNETILKNSIELLQKNPDDKELRRRVERLAAALARPQAPSPLAWKYLVEQGILKDGMSIVEAERVLGHPTRRKDGVATWYFNFEGFHVFPMLQAELDGETVRKWTISRG